MCIAMISFSVNNVKNFEINPSHLIKPFCYITKKSSQKRKYLNNEKVKCQMLRSNEKHFSLLLALSCQKLSRISQRAFKSQCTEE